MVGYSPKYITGPRPSYPGTPSAFYNHLRRAGTTTTTSTTSDHANQESSSVSQRPRALPTRSPSSFSLKYPLISTQSRLRTRLQGSQRSRVRRTPPPSFPPPSFLGDEEQEEEAGGEEGEVLGEVQDRAAIRTDERGQIDISAGDNKESSAEIGTPSGTPSLSCLNCTESHICLRGQCVCPVGYAEPDCRTPVAGLEDPKGCAGLLGYNAPWLMSKTQLGEMANFTTCAVVGSGTRAYQNMASVIDSHSAVFRFNEAPTKGFESKVGSKTTIRMQNRDHCGFSERRGEICLFYSMVRSTNTGTKRCLETLKTSKCRGVLPSSRARDFAQFYWRRHKRPDGANEVPTCTAEQVYHINHSNRKINCRPPKISSGYYGILLALHLCGEVNVFLFDGTNKHYYKKVVYGSQAFVARHQWEAERICQQTVLSKLDRLSFY